MTDGLALGSAAGHGAPDVLGDALRVPDSLAARVQAALDGVPPDGTGGDLPDRHLAAAEALLGRLLRDHATARDSAGDLLAADALATHAFELAGDAPERVPGLARAAMARFVAVLEAAARQDDPNGGEGAPLGGDR